MKPHNTVVAGVDVGASEKGFHAVALVGHALHTFRSGSPKDVVTWCKAEGAKIVAVDAPCGWSVTGKSRMTERTLAREGIHCYATPNRKRAQGRPFYGWVLNGHLLYHALRKDYRLFDGQRRPGNVCFETFPHAIVCALSGQVVPARPKGKVRRGVLQKLGFDTDALSNIDFVDAALCAIAADSFRSNAFVPYGDKSEGFIVVPPWRD